LGLTTAGHVGTCGGSTTTRCARLSYTGRMADALTSTAATAPASADLDDNVSDQQLVEDELLVEEISIDGMCGVY